MKPLVLLLLLGGAAGAAPSRLDRAFGGYERVVDPARVRELGEAAVIAYADDPSTPPSRRQRALAALRFVPGAAARLYLLDVVARHRHADRGAAVLDLAAAIVGLTPYGVEMLPTITPMLAHVSADARQAAATVLGHLRDRAALPALQTRLVVEPDSGVRAALQTALARLSE